LIEWVTIVPREGVTSMNAMNLRTRANFVRGVTPAFFALMWGVPASGQCLGDADCNDFNACTSDACNAGTCEHTPTNVGGPCGNTVNDICTDPDTCDANGNCLPNDAPDGGDCGGPDCLAGLCGPTTYRAQLLPEDGNIGSAPWALARAPRVRVFVRSEDCPGKGFTSSGASAGEPDE